MTATEARWTARVASWRASGKTATAFAEEIGCAPASLRWWSSQVVKREKLAPDAGVARKPTVRIARVVRTRSPSSPSRPGTSLVVEIGRGRIELQRGVDRELLRDVFAALGAER